MLPLESDQFDGTFFLRRTIPFLEHVFDKYIWKQPPIFFDQKLLNGTEKGITKRTFHQQ